MSAPRWRRIEELFQWAVEQDPSSRSAGLAQRCGGDGELMAEVDSLLAARESTDDFLETPAAERIARVRAGMDEGSGGPDSRRGARIGRYRLERVLGRGGMGVVYEAWQEDLRRWVALKLVRAGALADPLYLRRFRREAESLGRLDHPGIARIFEAGVDGSGGHHWFAMELVRGRPLAEYVRAERPTRAARLELFVRICQAVDHAHRQGVVHRDLKPSNVMVVTPAPGTAGAGPIVKVLDFGLAHRASAGDDGTRLTEPGRVFGTLPYMSPEQARGGPDAIAPASDVYSLGVILYELLSGRLPLDVAGLLLPAAVRRIGADLPQRLGRVDRELRGDLETIAAKALEKEPALRYAGAAELASDVERHLAGRPIAARPPSVAYQARKLVSRHKLLFGAAFLLLTTFAAAALVSGVLYVRAREAEQRARVEAWAALEVTGFLQEMLASARPRLPDHELSVREVLERAAARLEARPPSDPEVGAALHATIGDSFRALGLYERAEKHLETALWVRRGGRSSAELAKNLHDLAMVRLEQGRLAESEALAREAVELLRNAGLPGELARALLQLGNAVRLGAASTAELDEARALYEEALALADDPAAREPEALAGALDQYAGVLAAQGDDAGAEEHYRRALELHRSCFGDADLRVASTENDLAIVLARGPRLEEAVALTRRALSSNAKILGREHPTTVALANNLGSLLVRAEALDEGEALLAEALDARVHLFGVDHPDVGRTLSLLADVARRRDDLEGARTCLARALEVFRAGLGERHVEVANAETSLALLELDAGDAAAALPHARLALEVYRRVLPAPHPSLPQSEGVLGRTLLALGEHDEAESFLTRSLETLATLRGEQDPATRRALRDLLALHRATGAREKTAALAARFGAASERAAAPPAGSR